MPTFDVRYAPWIPVVDMDGNLKESGVRDALCRAHDLREIRDPMPTVEFGLYRLLTAFILDIFRLEDTEALSELLSEGHFDSAKIDAYLENKEWGNHFDLFHPLYPFLQTAGMDTPTIPLAGLLHPIPSGTNATHFHHALETDCAVCPAVAARLLTTLAPFAIGSGRGWPQSINGAPPWYVLIVGTTLFETLCLNVCTIPLSLSSGIGIPAWRAKPLSGSEVSSQASLLEAMTWRPRRVQLLSDSPGRCTLSGVESPTLVREMKIAPGLFKVENWRDPSAAYKIRTSGLESILPKQEREIWRDTGAIALLREAEYEGKDGKGAFRVERPALVTQFAELAAFQFSKRSLELQIYGLETDQAKVIQWQRERLTLPRALVWKSRFRYEAQHSMDLTDSVAYHLGKAIKLAYPRNGAGNKGAFGKRIADAQRRYWMHLRIPDDHYSLLLEDLAQDDETVMLAARKQWQATLRDVGAAALNETIDDLDTNSEDLRRQIDARKYFHAKLSDLFLTPDERAARYAKRKAKRATSTT